MNPKNIREMFLKPEKDKCVNILDKGINKELNSYCIEISREMESVEVKICGIQRNSQETANGLFVTNNPRSNSL